MPEGPEVWRESCFADLADHKAAVVSIVVTCPEDTIENMEKINSDCHQPVLS